VSASSAAIESSAVADRRRHQPTRVEEAHHVAILLDAVLVAHRTTGARGRGPVHLTDVVVGLVVAHGLELGAEAERSAREQTRVSESSAAQRGDDAARGRDVGVDDDLRVGCPRELPASETERPDATGSHGREFVSAAAARGDVRFEPSVGLGRLDRDVGTAGWRTRTRAARRRRR